MLKKIQKACTSDYDEQISGTIRDLTILKSDMPRPRLARATYRTRFPYRNDNGAIMIPQTPAPVFPNTAVNSRTRTHRHYMRAFDIDTFCSTHPHHNQDDSGSRATLHHIRP